MKVKVKKRNDRLAKLSGPAKRIAQQTKAVLSLQGNRPNHTIRSWLKTILSSPSERKRYSSLAHEVADALMERIHEDGQLGFQYLKLLLETMDKGDHITLDDLEQKIRSLFHVVCRHVKDPDALRKIADDLGLMGKEEGK